MQAPRLKVLIVSGYSLDLALQGLPAKEQVHSLDDAALIASRRLAVLGPAEQEDHLVSVVRGLLALAARERLARLEPGHGRRLRPAG